MTAASVLGGQPTARSRIRDSLVGGGTGASSSRPKVIANSRTLSSASLLSSSSEYLWTRRCVSITSCHTVGFSGWIGKGSTFRQPRADSILSSDVIRLSSMMPSWLARLMSAAMETFQ
jgi:hypothetical protein